MLGLVNNISFSKIDASTTNFQMLGWFYLVQSLVFLVGGASTNEGNVFAFNPLTSLLGPVCDDDVTTSTVSKIGYLNWLMPPRCKF